MPEEARYIIRHTTASMVTGARQALHRFVDDERGATAVEYALLASLIGVAIIGATTTLGQQIKAVFTAVTGRLNASP